MVEDKTGTRSKTPTALSPRAMQILEATEALLAERGPDGISMRDIAQRAGVNKALIFYYFGSRAEAFDKVLERYYRNHASVVEAATAQGGSPRDKVLAVLDAYLDFLDEKGSLYARLLHHELARQEVGLEGIRDDLHQLLEVMDEAVGDKLPETGPLSMPHFFATLLSVVAGSYAYPGALADAFDIDPNSTEGRRERRAHVKWVAEALVDRALSK